MIAARVYITAIVIYGMIDTVLLFALLSRKTLKSIF